MVPAGPSHLPNELVCAICSYSPAVDVVHLLSTCKALRMYMTEETIWKHLCAGYGVRDPADLGGQTFFQVYTELLHVYGPLIGLWASDLPFLGGIIEFRIDRELKTILGEQWCTNDRQPSNVSPALPTYQALVSISLPSAQSAVRPGTSRQREIDIRWTTEELNLEGGVIETVLSHATDADGAPTRTFKLFSPTDASSYILNGSSYSLLPDFPSSSIDSWYDPNRELPRLPCEQSPAAYLGPLNDVVAWFNENDEGDEDLDDLFATGTAMITAKGQAVKPTALYMHDYTSLRNGRWGNHRRFSGLFASRPWIPFISDPNIQVDASLLQTRLYPLRPGFGVGEDPADEHWHPASLEGLWLGNYGPHGTELLWLSYHAAENVVKAVKVTGDCFVPRGAISWTIDVSERVDATQQAQLAGYMGIPLHRVYRSQGTISSSGFREEDRNTIPNVAVIIGLDEIGVEWVHLVRGAVVRYRRCPQRNPENEEEISPYCRRAPVDPV